MNRDNPLGKISPAAERYAPGLLFPIERAEGRSSLGLAADALPFLGEDLWHAWELSWLDGEGMPQVRVGRFRLPAETPNLIESKSLKLYLGSLNQTRFASERALVETLTVDLSETAGAAVGVELLALDSAALQPGLLPGSCIDGLTVPELARQPDAGLLQPVDGSKATIYHSHLLRSLCPVTGQPDWATVVVHCAGTAPEASSLLAYLLSYRQHREFHEQCVERMFCDLLQRCRPQSLSVQALYTRRGGLDINPWRSTDRAHAPNLRTARQ